VLPNAIAPLIAQVSLDLAGTLLTAASLGFLGLGAQPPTPEWGTMVSAGLQYTLSAWWYPTFPGLAIFVTALALNSLGEYLRDVFAPETVI
jgi:peptide/nickel transport system permease protein